MDSWQLGLSGFLRFASVGTGLSSESWVRQGMESTCCVSLASKHAAARFFQTAVTSRMGSDPPQMSELDRDPVKHASPVTGVVCENMFLRPSFKEETSGSKSHEPVPGR